MIKDSILIRFLLFALLLFVVVPVWGKGNVDPKQLKGANIVIGNWWENYNTDTWKPRSDYEERELEYRKKIQRDYGFKIQARQIASYEQIGAVAATSTMAGKPAAQVVFLEPRVAMTMHNRRLLAPLSDSKAVDFNATDPVVWNQDVRRSFTFNNKVYAMSIGYGSSMHAQVLYFNKRLFREAGLDPNLPYDMQKAGTWKWDAFLEICKKLTRDINNDGIIDTYAMTADLSTEILDAIVSSNGANYIDRDSRGRFVNATGRPEFLEALQFSMRLKREGVMMPEPENKAWNWYQAMFNNGRVAIRIEPHYVAGQLGNMEDDWGMVLFPMGPRAKNYVVYTDENVMVVPSTYKGNELDKILMAVQLWFTPLDDDWKSGIYHSYRDTRAVDETVALIRNPSLQVWKYHLFIPGLERGDIAWAMWWHEGDPAQLVESVEKSWNALIDEANKIISK
uniref:N-acetyl-D-glucosamine ABC transport system, sugar-binding protein n=1 Tax=uncultured bacterium contig00100 TaxID=1181567 RepID=A0A806KCW1_9BACT|nr:N-acetyl-D-glucosamine ABC transport system, sugar-binding protein [uncultured bacterium contig00100]